MANNSPVLIWMSGLDQRCVFFNRPWLEFTGRSFEQETATAGPREFIPKIALRCLAIYRSAFVARQAISA